MPSQFYFIKHFFEESPSLLLGILTVAGNLFLVFTNQATPLNAVVMNGAVLLYGSLLVYIARRKKGRGKALKELREALTYYKNLIDPKDQNSPVHLLNSVVSDDQNELLQERLKWATVLHHIISCGIQNNIEITERWSSSDEALESNIKELEEIAWKNVNWYHSYIVGELFQEWFRTRRIAIPFSTLLREPFSRFCVRYNKALEMMASARKTANSECGLKLEADIDRLTVIE